MVKRDKLWDLHFPQLTECMDDGTRQLINSAKVVQLPANHLLFHPGASCRNYLLLLSGTVHTRMLNESGREVFLYRVCPGESCILTTSCLLGDSSYPAEGVTMEEVTAFSIAKEDFFRALDDSKTFRQFVFSSFSNRLANVIRRMEELMSGDIDRRLARILLSGGGNQVAKTHQDLAVELGTAREVITRHFKRFAQNGWIRLGRGMIDITDRQALELFVGDQKRL